VPHREGRPADRASSQPAGPDLTGLPPPLSQIDKFSQWTGERLFKEEKTQLRCVYCRLGFAPVCRLTRPAQSADEQPDAMRFAPTLAYVARSSAFREVEQEMDLRTRGAER
jgi:hypothetical protein